MNVVGVGVSYDDVDSLEGETCDHGNAKVGIGFGLSYDDVEPVAAGPCHLPGAWTFSSFFR